MLEGLLHDIEKHLGLKAVKGQKELQGKWTIKVSDREEVVLHELNPGIHFHGVIAPLPLGNREDLFIYLMQANFLGQGTGGCVIGLDPNDQHLTLSMTIMYDLNYRIFKDKLEEYFNYLGYWREEVKKLSLEAE